MNNKMNRSRFRLAFANSKYQSSANSKIYLFKRQRFVFLD
jgi:hypothetical protein